MKVIVSSALMADKIIALLTEYGENGVVFHFLKKNGIQMEFEVSGIEGQAACDLAKSLIKESEFGSVLYFSVRLA